MLNSPHISFFGFFICTICLLFCRLYLYSKAMSMITEDSMEQRFVASGEKDRMKELLRQRLQESGWMADVETKCKSIIKEKGIENVSSEDLLVETTAYGRKAVPESVKRELMQSIHTFLMQETGLTEL